MEGSGTEEDRVWSDHQNGNGHEYNGEEAEPSISPNLPDDIPEAIPDLPDDLPASEETVHEEEIMTPSANANSNGHEMKMNVEIKNLDENKVQKQEEEEEETNLVEEEVEDEEIEEDEDEEEDEEEESEEEEEEDLILENRLRKRQVNHAGIHRKKERHTLRQISQILKKAKTHRNVEETEILSTHPKLTEKIQKRFSKKKRDDERKLEVEDSVEVLHRKCVQLAKAIEKARNLVVYTGAGISTAANIPDYRGPNGVWTLLDQGKEIAHCNLDQAEPTLTHMALFTLYKLGKLKHVVSQNCDGLHMRSGLPRASLSEIHGNMFIEICKQCKPMRPFVRVFDVTERTNKNKHTTMRRCYVCGNSLFDTIVHFGERGSLKWPINWKGATKAAEKADVILCLGSSLKVLRRYSWLWCMDRPPKLRPKLYIVNLQWTPKDSNAKIKLNGRCDYVMQLVMDLLDMKIPKYHISNDPLLSYATPLSPFEQHTCSKNNIVSSLVEDAGDDSNCSSYHKTENGRDAISTDHDYANPGRPRRSKPLVKGRDSEGNINFRTMPWPRDALYLPYEPSFEYIEEDAIIGENAFCCDCCDPAKQKKRKDEETSSEEEEEEGEVGLEEEDNNVDSDSADSKSSKASSLINKNGLKLEIMKSEIKEEFDDATNDVKTEVKNEDDESCSSSMSSTPTMNSKPGWFGKGRRKKPRMS